MAFNRLRLVDDRKGGRQPSKRGSNHDAENSPTAANKRNYAASANNVGNQDGRPSKRRRFERAITSEEQSASHRTSHDGRHALATTKADKRSYTNSTNDADDETGRPTKRQKPTSYHSSKVARPEYGAKKRYPAASSDGSLRGVTSASTSKNVGVLHSKNDSVMVAV
ncbi:hypothetical protein BM221_003810 [Beauveria bassiana]|uniref:Uncharacterized protein n=1 Tax=Beauveria bassiana TaxID=176275 RepID=A0A2N6NVN8_BEABA|nr:hypothetical protein BM221_003810 [Beauveria bassiana]